MQKVRVLILTSLTYIYGSKVSYKRCGDSFYLDPSLPEDFEELKYVLESSYLKKGLVYLEDYIIYDYKNSLGLFAKVDNKIQQKEKEVPVVVQEDTTVDTTVFQEDVVEEIVEDTDTITEEVVDFRANRIIELNNLNASEIREMAKILEIEYTNKAKTIEAIVSFEYPD